MKKLCIAVLGVLLLLALHLTSQVAQARNGTTAHHRDNTTAHHRDNTTVRPTGTACGSTAAFTVLLPPLALTTLLHRWF